MSNLNERLQPIDSIPATKADTQVPWKFGAQQPIQGKQVRLSRININNFIDVGTVATGTFSLPNGLTANLTVFQVYASPRQGEPTFTLPHIAIYQGTVASRPFQIYPAVGGSVATGSYTAWGGFNYEAFNGTYSYYTASLSNISGADGTFSYAVQAQFIYFNSGVLG